MRLIRRQRGHSIVGDAPRLHEVIVRPVGGEQSSFLLPCITDHLLVAFVDVATRLTGENAPVNLAPTTRVIAGIDCVADKLQIQYCVLGTVYWVHNRYHFIRNTKGVGLPATVSLILPPVVVPIENATFLRSPVGRALFGIRHLGTGGICVWRWGRKVGIRNVTVAAVGAAHVCECWAHKPMSAKQEGAHVSWNPQWSTLPGLHIL